MKKIWKNVKSFDQTISSTYRCNRLNEPNNMNLIFCSQIFFLKNCQSRKTIFLFTNLKSLNFGVWTRPSESFFRIYFAKSQCIGVVIFEVETSKPVWPKMLQKHPFFRRGPVPRKNDHFNHVICHPENPLYMIFELSF